MKLISLRIDKGRIQMKTKTIFLLLLMITSGASAQSYQIDWWVIGSGGGHSQSSSFQLDGTIGQPIVGSSSSASYRVDAGFWVGAAPAGPVCNYVPGDVNGAQGGFTGLDVVFGVNYLKYQNPPPRYSCDCPPHGVWYVVGDVNASCTFTGLDITKMVAYLKGGTPLVPCPDCPPGGRLTPPVPEMEPIRKAVLREKEIINPTE